MALSWHNGCKDVLIRALRVIPKPIPELRIAELGNQIAKHRRSYLGAVKTYFEFFGAYHISFDWNGKNGALAYDLCKPIANDIFHDAFDLVTNFGTTEHVADQAAVFRNIHWLCRPGGVMVHVVPWPATPHGDWSYTTDWFSEFAETQAYEVLHLEKFCASAMNWDGAYAHAILLKIDDREFNGKDFITPPPQTREED